MSNSLLRVFIDLPLFLFALWLPEKRRLVSLTVLGWFDFSAKVFYWMSYLAPCQPYLVTSYNMHKLVLQFIVSLTYPGNTYAPSASHVGKSFPI